MNAILSIPLNCPFYLEPFYSSNIQKELAADRLEKVISLKNCNEKLQLIKDVVSKILFPINIYRLAHIILGKIGMVPASSPLLMGLKKEELNQMRTEIAIQKKCRFKRLSLASGRNIIDVLLMINPSFKKNRWLVIANGHMEFYENELKKNFTAIEKLSKKIEANIVFFNYPGVGASTGFPSKKGIVQSFKKVYKFLKDESKGLGAKEIICYGKSFGAAVQAEALASLSDPKCVFIASHCYSSTSDMIRSLVGKKLAFLAKILGWEISPLQLYRQVKTPLIVMQSARVKKIEELKDAEKIKDDSLIAPAYSLAQALLSNQSANSNVCIYGVPQKHNEFLEGKSIQILADKILHYCSS